MTDLDLRPEILLPHDPPMVLIDEIIEFGDDFAKASITPAINKPFANAEGNIPVWIGMEYMAQTIGAYAGIQAQKLSEPVKVGFLLGTRSYDTSIDQFECGHSYLITARKIYDDDGLGAFECTIFSLTDSTEASLVSATISTFQPDDISGFMERGRV